VWGPGRGWLRRPWLAPFLLVFGLSPGLDLANSAAVFGLALVRVSVAGTAAGREVDVEGGRELRGNTAFPPSWYLPSGPRGTFLLWRQIFRLSHHAQEDRACLDWLAGRSAVCIDAKDSRLERKSAVRARTMVSLRRKPCVLGKGHKWCDEAALRRAATMFSALGREAPRDPPCPERRSPGTTSLAAE